MTTPHDPEAREALRDVPVLRLTGEQLDMTKAGERSDIDSNVDLFAVDWDEWDEFVRLDDVRAALAPSAPEEPREGLRAEEFPLTEVDGLLHTAPCARYGWSSGGTGFCSCTPTSKGTQAERRAVANALTAATPALDTERLRAALDLVRQWDAALSTDTPEAGSMSDRNEELAGLPASVIERDARQDAEVSNLSEPAALAADLRLYADHLPECAAWGNAARCRRQPRRAPLSERCNCGLVDALTRANAR